MTYEICMSAGGICKLADHLRTASIPSAFYVETLLLSQYHLHFNYSNRRVLSALSHDCVWSWKAAVGQYNEGPGGCDQSILASRTRVVQPSIKIDG
jgi:hypothetical protein